MLIIFVLNKNVKRFCKKHLKNKKPPPSGSGEVFEAQVRNSARYEVFEAEVRKLQFPGGLEVLCISGVVNHAKRNQQLQHSGHHLIDRLLLGDVDHIQHDEDG